MVSRIGRSSNGICICIKQRGEVELYDLAVDPSESNSVADEHPEIVARLRNMLRAWVVELPEEYETLDDRKGIKDE